MTLKDRIFRKRRPKAEFKALAYPHMTLLYNVALKYCGNVFDAEDIVQETYMMGYDKFHQLRDKSKVKPWLLRILRNNFLKSYHKNQGMKKLPRTDYIDFITSAGESERADAMLETLSDRKAVRKAMDQLPEKYRTILLLYYMDDLLYKEIAAALNIPMGTVMSRLTRAREALKTIILKQANVLKNNILTLDLSRKKRRVSQ